MKLFQLKREKYEKMINDASSSYDTNFNSKEAKNNENKGWSLLNFQYFFQKLACIYLKIM